MNFHSIKFEYTTSAYLKALKASTGITPNLLCRIAFCLSVEDPAPLDPATFQKTDSDRIIERPVLLGIYDPLFTAMMKQRLYEDGFEDPGDEDLLAVHFRAHVHRGIHLLFKRVKNPADLARLVPRSPAAMSEAA